MGFDTASDEIDLLEIHGDYPRAHLTRFVSLYTTGRSRFAISYPNDPTALALPLDNGRSIRGEEISTSIWQSSPVPALAGFHGPAAQPVDVPGRADADLGRCRSGSKETGASASSSTSSELELRDAILIESDGSRTSGRSAAWGRSTPGRPSRSTAGGRAKPPTRVDAGPGPDPNPFLEELRTTWEDREENQGELRLVAWVAGHDRRPGDRAGRRSPARVHRGPGPSAQRPPAQPRRQALQPAGRRRARRRRGCDLSRCRPQTLRRTEQCGRAGHGRGRQERCHRPAPVQPEKPIRP